MSQKVTLRSDNPIEVTLPSGKVLNLKVDDDRRLGTGVQISSDNNDLYTKSRSHDTVEIYIPNE